MQHQHGRARIAVALATRQQLQGMALELHGVVPGHSSFVFKAQDLPQAQIGRQGLKRGIGALGGNLEAPVEAGQELLQHRLGLLHGGRPCQPQFRDQPVLEGSSRSLYPYFGLRRQGENHLDTQLIHGPCELGGLAIQFVLEDGVAVGVQGHRYAAAPYQSLHQQEIVEAVLLLTEQGIDHSASGVVHRQQQGEWRAQIAQPAVTAAVQLDQHAFPGHALPAHPVLGRTPASRACQTSVDQDAPQCGPGDVDALPFVEQLRKVSMVGVVVNRASQVNHPAPDRLGNGVGRLDTPEAMGQGAGSVTPVSLQYAPGVSRGNSHEFSCLVQGNLLRKQVLNSLLAEQMTLDQAAALMGVSVRHTRRILDAYRERGAAALVHGNRGREPPNATPMTVVTDVVHLARTRYAGANHTHLSELLSERDGIDVGRSALRRILIDTGLNSPRRRRPPKHRVRRQRMPREGLLVQMDGSHHPWLGDQVPPFALLIAVDDATGTVLDALFCEKEDARSYFLLVQGLVQHHGAPVALYIDRHGVFRHTPGSGLPGMSAQFSRAIEELGIQMIFALSPQAKGRVERGAGTLQDRLVTELRLAGASSIGEANSVLEQFLPRFNRRFGVPPRHAETAFRPLDPEVCLEHVLCFKHRRTVARDNTVRFRLHALQLLPGPERLSYAGAVVEVLEGLDGRLSVRHEGRIVPSQEAPPDPVFLRNSDGHSPTLPSPPSGAHRLDERWRATLTPPDSGLESEEDHEKTAASGSSAGKTKSASPRKATLVQRERWKAIQKARRKGMSLRAIERDLGIHRATVKKYLDAEGPSIRRLRPASPTPPSGTMAT